MNAAHWHLALNHFPVISVIVGTMILLFSHIFLNRNKPVKNTALCIVVIAALTAVPAYFTGEEAEEMVEDIPAIVTGTIEYHEDLGKGFFIAVELLGLFAIGSLIAGFAKSKLSSIILLCTILAATGVSIFGLQVANSGGKIRHSEINGNTQSVHQSKSVFQESHELED